MVVPDPLQRFPGTLERTPAQETVPWQPFARPLPECRFALVTTGGIHLVDQPPFDMTRDGFDWSYREIPSDTRADRLMVTHNHYNHAHVDQDSNAMLPLDRFRELRVTVHHGEHGGHRGERFPVLPPQENLCGLSPEASLRLCARW